MSDRGTAAVITAQPEVAPAGHTQDVRYHGYTQCSVIGAAQANPARVTLNGHLLLHEQTNAQQMCRSVEVTSTDYS